MARILPDLYEELRAILAARRELGPEHDEMLVSTFLQRLDREIDHRMVDRRRSIDSSRLAVIGLALAIPIEAIAGAYAGEQGLIAGLLAVVVMVVAGSLRR